jgi:hypothetical protein
MKTTLNVQNEVLKKIVGAAQSRGIPCSEMILLLIKKVTVDMANPGRIGRLVRYQERHNPEDWHVFHVKVREDMYEYWLDLRKLLKMSVSLILAYAVKRFLSKSLKIRRSDNYLCNSYFIVKQVIDSVTIWKLIWGCPPNLGKLIN